MQGYSEIGTIYFLIGEYTSYARYYNGLIESGTYKGEPPFQAIKGSIPKELKQYHAAEHKVYNAFMQKIRDLDANTRIEELRKHIPSIEEVRKASSSSYLCGTTIFLLSGLSLFLVAMPNLFDFANKNILQLILWMTGSVILSLAVSLWIQRKNFLSEPEDRHLVLGIEALKEALNNENIND